MYCEKVEKNDGTAYGRLLQRAAKKGIDVYEVDKPKEINGLFYNFINEGIEAKIILVNICSNKEFTLAYLLEYIRIAGTESGHIMIKEKDCKKAAERRAGKCAARVISLLKRGGNP